MLIFNFSSCLEKLEIDNKFINKQVRLFVHKMMCLSKTCWKEKKLLGHHNKYISVKIAFVK